MIINLNKEEPNQLTIYSAGLRVEQGTIQKYETHLLIRERFDQGISDLSV